MTEARPSPSGRHGRSSRRTAYLLAGLLLLTLGAALNLDTASEAPQLERSAMGTETKSNASGLYAMKGPPDQDEDVVGEASGVGDGSGSRRHYSSEGTMGRPGILGQLQGESGHFLASPYSIVGGPEVLPAEAIAEPGFVVTADDARSTFSVDVDTAAYARIRGELEANALPSRAQVRVEEMINYFDYDYPEPKGEAPFAVVSEVGPCPWNPANTLVHIGLRGKVSHDDAPKNLVFLVDTSGSMSRAGGLDLVKSSLRHLSKQLMARDRVAIVAYAGSAGLVLPPTPGDDTATILDAVDGFVAGGGTNGAAGIELAYQLADEYFIRGGVNRVLLATDGDFNVGVASHEALVEMIEGKRDSGVFLSVLGFRRGGADHTMEQLADKGNGNYAFIDSVAEARKVLAREAGSTLVAVAMFGDKLSAAEYTEASSWHDVSALARTAVGEDTYGYRKQLLRLLGIAQALEEGTESPPSELPPKPQAGPIVPHTPEVLVLVAQTSEPTWGDEIRNTLRLLPPLLALPMFIMAFRPPRRRREDEVA